MNSTTRKVVSVIREYIILTFATFLLVFGVYIFKFPNHFSFGGVTGIAMILQGIFGYSASSFTFIINMLLLAFGFIFLGKTFGVKTVYVSVLMSVLLGIFERFIPLNKPITNEPVLELIFAIVLPALSAAILFNRAASSGGTDIIAMILKKYTHFNIGTALFLVDLIITIAACFVFDAQTGLFSFCGLMAKSLVIDNVIESINLCKYFTIICDNPDPICEYINKELQRSATIFKAEGSYSGKEKTIILTVMKRHQAVMLRNYIKQREPLSFIMITNSSEIIGKGFRGLN